MNVYRPYTQTTSTGVSNRYLSYNVHSCFTTYDEGNDTFTDVTTHLYRGRSWSDAHDETNVYFSSLLQDNVYLPKTEYDNDVQKYRWETWGMDFYNPLQIEKNGALYNNFWLYSIEGGQPFRKWVETTKPTVELPSFNVPYTPYDRDGVLFFDYDTLQTTDKRIYPHIPWIKTDNFYFACVLGWNYLMRNDIFQFGTQVGKMIKVAQKNQYGNFIFMPTLADCYGFFNYGSGNIMLSVIAEGKPEHDVPSLTVLAKIDECPWDYYISWWTPWGSYQSQGFNGRYVTKREEMKKENITTLIGQKKPIQTDADFKFELKRMCDKDMHRLLNTIPTSPCIYVYDVKNDFGTMALCTDNTVTETKRGVNEFTLNLETIQHFTFR